MDTQKSEVCLEEFKCRIPALFPYISWNNNGTTETHVATDSSDGSYGKIIDNMKIPEDVKLTNFIQIQENEIPGTYTWDETNTILISESTTEYFSTNESLYLRKVLWYRYVIVDEMYPDAVKVDSIPSMLTDESPEHIKIAQIGPDGSEMTCFGNIIYTFYQKVAGYYFYKRQDIIKPCSTYSYRTIITTYYKYKPIVGENNSFIKFVEDGIGRVLVDRNLLNLTDEDIYSEVPEFVYLSQVKSFKALYDKYKEAYIHYQNYYQANGKTSLSLKEKADKYVRMGGDNFNNWLGQLLQKTYDTAAYYKCLSDNKDFSPRFSLELMLCNKTQVLGLESVYENVFTPGNRYYDGDLLTHNGRTYVCILDRLVEGGNNYEYIRKNIEINGVYVNCLLSLNESQDAYDIVSNANVSYIQNGFDLPDEHATDYIVLDEQTYKWDEVEEMYVLINVTEYSTGFWDEETERYVFDAQHFVLISELDDYDSWYNENNLFGEDFTFFVDMEYIPSYRIYDYIRFNGNIFQWDEDEAAYVPSEGNEWQIGETTNSKLRDLRISRNYINEFGKAEEPDMEEDWLYYYKVGTITGKIEETDEFGNLISDTSDFIPGEPCYYLHAYGNIINSITYDSDTNTVSFVYVIGAHLIAIADKEEVDADGNLIRYYKDFSYDEYSDDGVMFTETYQCKDDSISALGSDFADYVNGDASVMLQYLYNKFPFETTPILFDDGSVSIEGSGVAMFDAYGNMQHSRTIRKEWMEGLYFQPKIKSGVSIDRGNGASFDRHIRLGEIRTMEELENYQNGAFYKLSEN